MGKEASIREILSELRAHAEGRGDDELLNQVRALEDALPELGGAISVGDISGSTAVAIGSDIQIILHQRENLPDELLKRLMTLADDLTQQADAAPRASARESPQIPRDARRTYRPRPCHRPTVRRDGRGSRNPHARRGSYRHQFTRLDHGRQYAPVRAGALLTARNRDSVTRGPRDNEHGKIGCQLYRIR